jgi:hypothetical protein
MRPAPHAPARAPFRRYKKAFYADRLFPPGWRILDLPQLGQEAVDDRADRKKNQRLGMDAAARQLFEALDAIFVRRRVIAEQPLEDRECRHTRRIAPHFLGKRIELGDSPFDDRHHRAGAALNDERRLPTRGALLRSVSAIMSAMSLQPCKPIEGGEAADDGDFNGVHGRIESAARVPGWGFSMLRNRGRIQSSKVCTGTPVSLVMSGMPYLGVNITESLANHFGGFTQSQ